MSLQNTLLSWFLRRRVRALRHSPLDPLRVRAGAEKMVWAARPATGWSIKSLRDLSDPATLPYRPSTPDTDGPAVFAPTPTPIETRAPSLSDGVPAATASDGSVTPPTTPSAAVLPAVIPGEWIAPTSPRLLQTSRRIVLYLHGGGYFFCSPRTHRAVTCALARRAFARVCVPDYRLAPEHPAPAALEDALRVWRALRAAGEPANQIVVAGDSAGGGLALALLQALRDADEPLPAAAVLFSPWTDLALSGETLVSHAGTDVLMEGQSLREAAALVLGSLDARDPRISPLYGDFRGLPPLLIQASDSEMLLDDARRVADLARQAGVDVTLTLTPRVPHAWQMFAPVLPEGRRAIEQAGRFIKRHTSRPI